MNRTILGFSALALATTLGCSTKPPVTDDFSELAGADEKSDKLRAAFNLVGSLDYGQTSSAVKYKNPPRYSAFKFGGNKGDVVTIDVSSKTGDAVAFLLDNSYNIIAQNDDASDSTLDSHIQATLPANSNPDIVTYYIAFRDYNLHQASFTVSLKGKVAAPDFYSCQHDRDCVAIDAGGCCPHGSKVAVNTSSVAAYDKSVQCQHPQICPLYLILDQRVAECNTGTRKCEMVQPGDIACGGFTTNPHACAPGYSCVGNPRIADVPGKCVQDGQGQACGGIAGRPCPAGQTCVDDPSDNCDPTKGGADCGGICQ